MTGRLRAPTGRYGGKSAEERQAERRRRFLDAGLQLFGDGPGYRGTTVAALSEAAGLSTRQFYEEFRTLEDVLAALHLQVNDWAEEAALAGLAEADGLPIAERATAAFRAYAANVTGDPRRLRITFVEIIGVSPRLERQRLARRSRWIDFICAEADGRRRTRRGGAPRLPGRRRGLHRQRQRPAARLEFGLGRRDARRGRRRTRADAPGCAAAGGMERARVGGEVTRALGGALTDPRRPIPGAVSARRSCRSAAPPSSWRRP